jgi:membrane-bound serine protease (ClpP class)
MNTATLRDATVGQMQEARTPGLSGMVGEVGLALTALRPAGRAEFGDVLLDVVTDGEFIERDECIQIAEVHGNRVVVVRHRAV